MRKHLRALIRVGALTLIVALATVAVANAAIAPGKTRLVQDCVGRDMKSLQQGATLFGGVFVTTDNAPLFFDKWLKMRAVLDDEGCVTTQYTHWSIPDDITAEKIVLQHRYLVPNMLEYWTLQANLYEQNKSIADQAFAAWQQQKAYNYPGAR